MECTNHPDVAAVDRCAGCAEGFCENCLVEIQGQRYCGKCKQMAVQESPSFDQAADAAFVDEYSLAGTCQEAKDALKYALIGIICIGIILQPIAIFTALEAKKRIRENPHLTGEGQANAALIIGICFLTLWVLGIIARFSG